MRSGLDGKGQTRLGWSRSWRSDGGASPWASDGTLTAKVFPALLHSLPAYAINMPAGNKRRNARRRRRVARGRPRAGAGYSDVAHHCCTVIQFALHLLACPRLLTLATSHWSSMSSTRACSRWMRTLASPRSTEVPSGLPGIGPKKSWGRNVPRFFAPIYAAKCAHCERAFNRENPCGTNKSTFRHETAALFPSRSPRHPS